MRKNQCHNSRPFSLAGWTGDGLVYVNAAGPIPGINGYVQASRTTAGYRNVGVLTPAPGKLGAPVTVSIYLRASAATTATGTIWLQNAAGQNVGGWFFVPVTPLLANQWTRIVVTGTATGFPTSITPGDHTHVQVSMTDQNNSATPTLRAAAVMVNEVGTYFDGDYPQAPPLSYWWNGLPYASASTEGQIIKATAKPETASVLVEVNVNPSLGPTEHFRLTSADIYGPSNVNDYYNWTGWDTLARSGSQIQFHTAASTGAVQRPISGLIVGRTYSLYVTATRGSLATDFSIAGRTFPLPTGKGTWTSKLEFVATATSESLRFTTAKNFTPALSLIRIDLEPVGGATSVFALTRTDVNGTAQVRLLEGQEITDGSLITEDYEAALTGPITYSLVYANGQRASASTALDVEGTFLAPSVLPQFGVSDLFITGYDASRETNSTAHAVIGREDPVVRIGAVRSRRGTLTIWASDYAAMRSVLDVYRRGEVVLLRQAEHAGLDLFHVALSVREGAYDERFKRWRLDVDFTEVRSPDGPLLGSVGWTWDDVAANFATWDDVTDFFATWNDLQIGNE